MEPVEAKRMIEAFLFVTGEPVPMKRLLAALGSCETAQLRQWIDELKTEYAATHRAFQIQEVAGGFQLVTDAALSPWLTHALKTAKPDFLTQASMETLAIIAYRQPITKAEIEAIRGVDVTATLETLVERKFIRVAGRKDTPGRPLLYGTTSEFLRHFGLQSVEHLPPLAPAASAPPATTTTSESQPLVSSETA